MEKRFAGLDGDILELLKQMLDFNYETRVDASQCLQNKLFDSIRDPSQEKEAASKVLINDHFTTEEEAVKILIYEIETVKA